LALSQIPEKYQNTLLGEQFLLHDSGSSPESSSEDSGASQEEDDCPERLSVIVFATRKNIEILCERSTWFLDGTFDTALNIFSQIFTKVCSQ